MNTAGNFVLGHSVPYFVPNLSRRAVFSVYMWNTMYLQLYACAPVPLLAFNNKQL